MTKSQSWNEGGLDRAAPTAANNDPWSSTGSSAVSAKVNSSGRNSASAVDGDDKSNSLRSSHSDYGLANKTSSPVKPKSGNSSLIDFGPDDTKLTRVSVLEFFDPLLVDEDEADEQHLHGGGGDEEDP